MLLRQLSRSPILPRFTRPIQLSSQRVVHHTAPKKPPARAFRRPHYPYGILCATSVLAQQSSARPDILARITSTRRFHSTPRREGPPVALLGLLKASTILEVIRAASRIALTFVPLILIKQVWTRKFLRRVDQYKEENPNGPFWGGQTAEQIDAKRVQIVKGLRSRTIFLHLLMLVPTALFGLVVLASIERTPLTGRLRTIVLSPEEEEAIAQQLAGPGWYQAVGDILARDSAPPRIVPPTDWRYAWVYSTLRQLEDVIPRLGDERSLSSDWTGADGAPDGAGAVPLPPPSEYPLRPRARASEQIRLFRCSITGERPSRGVTPHHIPGPPYALLVVDDPVACNAFSYGFGPDGAGGIVVFSGFLDRILRDNPTPPQPPPPPASWWSTLLGGAPARPPPAPTPEQTADLAVLLSHELSHLVLAHHLETLSSMTVLVPGTLSIVSDVLRTLLFPLTALFGPFVNDALASLGAAGSLELSKCGEYCTTSQQEIEADVVSARLLAHAGFDPRRAVRFWERRADETECAAGNRGATRGPEGYLAMRLFGAGHPLNEVRVAKLREELDRWTKEREKERAKLAKQVASASAASCS